MLCGCHVFGKSTKMASTANDQLEVFTTVYHLSILKLFQIFMKDKFTFFFQNRKLYFLRKLFPFYIFSTKFQREVRYFTYGQFTYGFYGHEMKNRT